MQKIITYLYPNRIQLLADLAGFPVEWTTVYQKTVKIYGGLDNVLEFDFKNADQKRIDLTGYSLVMHVMDAAGNALPTSPYILTALDQTAIGTKGLASVTIPNADLGTINPQYLKFSVVGTKNGVDHLFYADTRFGGLGTIQLGSSVIPQTRKPRVFDTFTAEIDLKGVPTWHSSAISAKFYEAVPTQTLSFEIPVEGFVGSLWLEATKNATVNTEAFKNATYIRSFSAPASDPATTTVTFNNINIGEYSYFRVSYSLPTQNGIGSSFQVVKTNNVYNVTIRAGGTGYAVGSQMKVLGSAVGGIDGINDLVITVTGTDPAGVGAISSYAVGSITSITTSGTASNGDGTYIVTGTNITGKVDKVVVS